VTTSAPPALPDETRPPKVRIRPAAALLEPAILRRAVFQAFVKLDPRVMIRIPVMFVVEIGSVITTIEFIGNPSLFVGLVASWLWATVLFANFAEAVAEGRGKAQADTLRKSRKETVAHRLTADGTIETVPSTELKVGDRRHARALGPDRRPGHLQSGRVLPRPDDLPGRGGEPAEDAE
jgi:K+-transporting ATPase ATPase B chain